MGILNVVSEALVFDSLDRLTDRSTEWWILRASSDNESSRRHAHNANLFPWSSLLGQRNDHPDLRTVLSLARSRYCPSQSVECWFYTDGSLDTVYRRITRRGQKTRLTRRRGRIYNCKTLQTPIAVEHVPSNVRFLVAFSSFVVFWNDSLARQR